MNSKGRSVLIEVYSTRVDSKYNASLVRDMLISKNRFFKVSSLCKSASQSVTQSMEWIDEQQSSLMRSVLQSSCRTWIEDSSNVRDRECAILHTSSTSRCLVWITSSTEREKSSSVGMANDTVFGVMTFGVEGAWLFFHCRTDGSVINDE